MTLPECPEITDDAIIRFCFDSDAVNPEGDEGETPCSYGTTPEWRVLRLAKPRIDGEFLVNLMNVRQKTSNGILLVLRTVSDQQILGLP